MNSRRRFLGLLAAGGLLPGRSPLAQDGPSPETWPGQIVFDVFYGEQGLRVGESTHRWHESGGRYVMEAHARTTGLFSLFGAFNYHQRSEGRSLPTGLIPERFTVRQAGKGEETAVFDWPARKVRIRRNDGKLREAPLAPGDQDVLSLWHQPGRLGSLEQHLLVVSNKAAKPARLSPQGSETLQLPLGELTARKVLARADDGSLHLELWLSPAHRLLPVRVRMTDKKGEVFDQRARQLQLP